MRDINFTQFGRYVLAQRLARGGMGQVYLSIYGDAGWEKFCALKRILPSSSSPDALLRFRSEVDISLRLNHSNLVSVFDVGIVNQQAYMAMELVEGENLRSMWNRCAEKRVPFPMKVILFMMKESAKALAYAHEFRNLELVHRDISPPNLMLTFSGEMKVLDFGLALSSSTKRLTKPGVIYGKMPYLSPEQARGEILTAKSDIYSLGIVLWELITGRRLFEHNEEDNLMEQLKERGKGPRIEKPSVISGRGDDELDAIVLSMLNPDPFQRPSGEDLITKIGTYLSKKYPGTDTQDASQFIHSLFTEEASTADEKRRELLEEYRAWRADATRSDVRPGDTVAGRYLITRVLGEGGMGIVYEAMQEAIGKRVAVKILEPKTSMSPEEAELRFKREAKAASRVQHPAVVSVLDYGFIAGGQPFLVMELLDGHSLSDVISQGPLETERACLLGAQLARGIQAAHEAGLIHRDIKPDNMHIVKNHRGEEQLKLFDFGISKSSLGEEEDLTRPGITLGTPEYIAPELLLGEKPTTAADIYSFGAVLYEFFTGSPPYSGNRTETIIQNKIKGKRKSIHQKRPDLSMEIKSLIESCLAQDPRKRPSSLASIADKLDAIHHRYTNPMSAMMQMIPAPAAVGIKHESAKIAKRYRNSETGSWMPLGLALTGVIVFVLGILQVGKVEVAFESFSTMKNPAGVLSFVAPSPVTPPEPQEKQILVRISKTSAPKKVAETPRRRQSRSARSRHPRRGAHYLSQAKQAFNRGEYPKAYVLARRSIKHGGGVSARHLHEKARRLMGLNFQ